MALGPFDAAVIASYGSFSTSECTFGAVDKARGDVVVVFMVLFCCLEPTARGKQCHPESKFQQNLGIPRI